MPMNPVEREVMGICIALEAINDMANHELFDVLVSSSYPEESEVRFKSRIHQEMFLLRLLDFTKEAGAPSITGIQGSCLEVLGAACKSRCFEVNGSVTRLAESVKNLRAWLDMQDTLALSITNLEIETEIELRREQLVFILGNQVKHNIARLTSVSKLVGNLLREHNHEVPVERVALALEDIREHLQQNYLVYYGTWLCELINNLRWGIQEYLTPVFQQSYVSRDSGKYEYLYPEDVGDSVAREWFWRLMEHARVQPYVARFVGVRCLKRASSLEIVYRERGQV